jgi:hypothetical protein
MRPGVAFRDSEDMRGILRIHRLCVRRSVEDKTFHQHISVEGHALMFWPPFDTQRGSESVA